MPKLSWDPTDLIEVLEVVPESEEHGTRHHFRVERDGLLLALTVWPFESVVDLALFRDGIEPAVFRQALFVRQDLSRVTDRTGESLRIRNCLPAPSRFSYLDFRPNLHDVERLPYGLTLRLWVKPHIRIEYEREPLD